MSNKEFIDNISLPGEEWRDIEGFEGSYMVSSFARVISLNRIRKNGQGYVHCKAKLLSQHLSKTGYYVVDLRLRCAKTTAKVHRLVAKAFIPHVEGKDIIDHINGIKTDNRISNLRWCTYKENNNFPIARHNRSASLKGRKLSPEHRAKCVAALIGRPVSERTRQKLSEKSGKPVVQMDLNGKYIATFKSAREAARALNISYKHISSCCLNKQKTSGGYVWRFA